jgi:Tfp pilus assembly protein PilX
MNNPAKIGRHIHKVLKEQNGYILGLVMIFFLVFTLLGLAFLRMAGDERIHVHNYQDHLKAFYNAEHGIYKGLYLLNKVSKAAATFSNDSVIVAYDSTNLTITAEGISGSVHDSIKVYLQATWPYVLYSDTDKLEMKKGSGTVTGDIHSNFDVEEFEFTLIGDSTEVIPDIAVPTIDWSFFETKAKDVSQYSTARITFTSAGSPYSGVWYTTDSVDVESGATINGTVVAENQIDIQANATVTATPSNYPAVLAKKNKGKNDAFFQENGVQITGFVYSGEEIKLKSDNFILNGGLVASTKLHDSKGESQTITLDTDYLTDLLGVIFTSQPGLVFTITKWEKL